MPENRAALAEWELFKLTGTLGVAHYGELGVRQVALMRAIARQVNRMEQAELKKAGKRGSR